MLIYAIGLEPRTARAIRADLPEADIRRRRPIRGHRPGRRRGPPPDIVLLDVTSTDVVEEIATARRSWGTGVPIVGMGRLQPYARIWCDDSTPALVEVGPGFLRPLIERAGG